MEHLTIRYAQESDIPQILHFIRELAAYEGLQAGKAPAEIDGIDPEIPGVNRVNGLKNMVLKEMKAVAE